MPVDTSNTIRVDLQEIFDSCEKQTRYHSDIFQGGELNQNIVICGDDYELIFPWANDAAVLIADACNYITNTSQTGLEAISNPFTTENPNPADQVEDIRDLMADQKQTGEYLSKAVMDTMQFNVVQMANYDPLKYTVTQSQIRAAMIEYILFKWYELNKINDEMAKKWKQFEFWLNKLKTNTFNNQKTIKTKKPYHLF